MNALTAVVAALVWTGLAFATRRRESLLGSDEGYLWYGTQRVLAGEQPVRDVRSYEPGRYWCTAVVALVRGDAGIVTVRLAAHLTAGAALAVLGVTLGAAGATPLQLVLAPLLVLAWRPAHYKLFDSAALVVHAAAGVALLAGMPGGTVALGASVGIAATVGLNLGLYATVSAVVVVASGAATGRVVTGDLVGLSLGVALGTVPLLVWWLLARGTATATWEARVSVPRRRGSTNLPLPVPLPWRPGITVRGAPTRATALLTRAGFVALPVVGLAAVGGALLGGTAVPRVVPVATIGLVAMHHAWSRADLSHLGLAAPFLLLAPSLLPAPWGPVSTVVAAATCLPLIDGLHPRRRRQRAPTAFVRRRLGRDLVWMPHRLARELDALSRHLRSGEAVAALPFGVWLLAALQRRSAARDTYCVYPAPAEDDERLRHELAVSQPVLVLIDDRPLDGRDDLRFSATHPSTWSWLTRVGSPVHDDPTEEGLPPMVTLWRVDSR